ncbi:MAG TPA: hypothetical protein VN132_04935, partial [Bdellovibrio sp.]|nr:hypothetical protein [Bdellovibrio sp.]
NLSPQRAARVAFRLKSLSQARRRFITKLDQMDQPRARPLKKRKHSLTAQPKMKVNLQGSAREKFHNSEQQKIYTKHSKERQLTSSPGRAMSKRIAGYMKARTRKGQVARDRVTSAKAE